MKSHVAFILLLFINLKVTGLTEDKTPLPLSNKNKGLTKKVQEFLLDIK